MNGWAALLLIFIVGASAYAIASISDKRTIEKVESGEIKVDDPLTEEKVARTEVVTSAELVSTHHGRIVGLFGVLLTILLWFVYIFVYEITTIQAQMVNYYTLTAGAALVSLFGLIFGDASSMLLAAAALVGACLMKMETAFFGLAPAILLMISHVRMKKAQTLKVKTESMDISPKQ